MKSELKSQQLKDIVSISFLYLKKRRLIY